jgi:hypothetical protein
MENAPSIMNVVFSTMCTVVPKVFPTHNIVIVSYNYVKLLKILV